ncbi:TetR/AcrR family transcriptional regulator [Limisalsivibrio acetivorans]|uniref:TetR/AcrR family transcriptional regulator n=1 Tax=Limisalsivibrio acetivorans TaxID=1304888 RepID=UPI0003B4326A|nr:TetR/AcrR family transcriptional regulator [Limisalsivibrio acetivorans]
MKDKDIKTVSEIKRESITEAAAELFLSNGFGSVSMDEIASKAEVSKRTVYNHFSSKEMLFAEVVRMTWSRLEAPELDPCSDTPVAVELKSFSIKLLELLRSETFTKLLRLVMGEAGRFPVLNEMYSENSVRPMLATLEEYLKLKSEQGLLKIDDPALASQQFLGIIKESLFWPVLLGIYPRPEKKREQEIIDSSIKAFFKIHGNT